MLEQKTAEVSLLLFHSWQTVNRRSRPEHNQMITCCVILGEFGGQPGELFCQNREGLMSGGSCDEAHRTACWR